MSAQILLVSLGGAASDRIADPLLAGGHSVDVVGGVNAAMGALAGRDLVIVDAAVPGAAAEACRQLRQRVGPGAALLALSPTDSVDERIALLEAGADDVLVGAFQARELQALVDALLARRGARPSPQRGGAPPSSRAGGPERPGRVIVFAAAKGGAGTTTLAVNTAVLLAARGGGIAIADLDLLHGQVGAHLNLLAQTSTAHLARDEQLAENPLLVRAAAVQHASGLDVLPAPLRPDEGGLVTVDDMLVLVNALRRAYATCVIDAGSTLGNRALTLVALADVSFIVVTPDIPGLRVVQGALDAGHDAGAIGEQTLFVLNTPHAHGAIERAEIERHLGVSIAAEVPHDGENSMRAANEGRPVITLVPKSAIADALRRVAGIALGEVDAEAEGEPEQRQGRLGGLLRRR